MPAEQFLALHPPFDRLPQEAIDRVALSVVELRAAAGEALLRRSDEVNPFLYVVRRGAVRLERDGRPIAVVEEGEVFGAPSLFSGRPPQFDAVAVEETLVYRFPGDAVRGLLEHPGVAEFFLSSLAERLKRSSDAEAPEVPSELAAPVGTVVRREPVFIDPEATIAEAARRMTEERIASLLVRSEPLGILTDRDLRSRVVARELPYSTPVSAVMTRPCRTTSADASLLEVLLTMLEQRIHHLPVVDDGRVIGLVTHSDVVRRQVDSPLHLLKRVERLSAGESFDDYADQLARMVAKLVESGLEAVRIGRIVASLNDALVARVLRLVEAQLGPPPCPYAWITFGSEGRLEQLLLTDQDNALIYLEDRDAVRPYFKELAQRTVDALLALSFPACPGGFMATNWCQPLPAWRRLFEGWIREPVAEALLDASIFFDYRVVHGELSLEPLEQIIRASSGHKLFLRLMARNALRFRPPLGFFNRVQAEADGVDLKAGGLQPIVCMARVRGLASGASERSTLGRIADAAAKGKLREESAATMTEAFRFLLRLRLDAQLAARRDPSARRSGSKVRLDELTPLQRRHLKDTFVTLRDLQEELALDFAVSERAE